MSLHQQIAEAIRIIAGEHKNNVYYGTVDSVDIPTRSCQVTITSAETELLLPSVQMQAAVGDGFVLIPVVDSTVLVYNDEMNPPCIIQTSDIDKIYINANLVQFNGGNNGGIINIESLVSKVNAIENLLNDLISKYNIHVHTGGTISGSTGVPTVTETTVISPITQRSDIEDTKIIH